MKKWIQHLFVLTFILLFSCQKDERARYSQIDTETPELSELDRYIRKEFVQPYNIAIQYKWDENEVDLNRFLYPPTASNIRPLLEIIKAIWIEPYNQVGGSDFIKIIAPRQFTLVGGYNYNKSGTITLGIAEGGVKITLFNVDQLDMTDINGVRRYFKTLQHEYGHILHQTKAFDPAYGQINPQFYTAQWFNVSDQQAKELGFISAYSMSNEQEDFVEIISEMLTNSKEEYDAIISNINSSQAQSILRQKEQLVVNYFANQWNIDIYELQEVIYNATLNVIEE
ncbi:MAG: putative zinc-binding metallopeptidase [Flavobacteriaceae bacterium]|nr:putative zinc-binding metallopeptidase [Flavobacteriaceae bacterium]